MVYLVWQQKAGLIFFLNVAIIKMWIRLHRNFASKQQQRAV